MALAVKKDMLVTLSVRMADMSGKILEESGPEGLTYLHGHGDIFPKLEAALEGRFPGEGFFIKLEPIPIRSSWCRLNVWATPRPWSVVLSSRACPARPMTADAGT